MQSQDARQRTCHDVRALRHVEDVVTEAVLEPRGARLADDPLRERPQAPEHAEQRALASAVGACDQQVGARGHLQCQVPARRGARDCAGGNEARLRPRGPSCEARTRRGVRTRQMLTCCAPERCGAQLWRRARGEVHCRSGQQPRSAPDQHVARGGDHRGGLERDRVGGRCHATAHTLHGRQVAILAARQAAAAVADVLRGGGRAGVKQGDAGSERASAEHWTRQDRKPHAHSAATRLLLRRTLSTRTHRPQPQPLTLQRTCSTASMVHSRCE